MPELIAFAHGSLLAYACAVYIRWKRIKMDDTEEDSYHVRLVCGKARVTPARGTTAPRSEVSGFLILTRLLKVVVNAMDTKPSAITIAVDSQCTISATEKTGGLLAPYFASRISEAMTNLSEIGNETLVHPIQHVPGPQNPADIPTRDTTNPAEVMNDSVWQCGPKYLTLDRDQWPFSRNFLDVIPEQELRRPKAFFNLAVSGSWTCLLGERLSSLVMSVMHRSNSYAKTAHVTARLITSIGIVAEYRNPLQ